MLFTKSAGTNIEVLPPALLPPLQKDFHRISSIDLLRGAVMIIMALDHVRDYFHADTMFYDPLDLAKTNVILFFTRWITHICAPVFVFLAGTSAFLSGQRKSKNELSLFLVKRGLWLMFLEVTVVNFGWAFNFKLPFIGLAVIWALGVCMVVLAAIIRLPMKATLVIGLLLVFGHNLLDPIHIDTFFWAGLHEPRIFRLDETHSVRTAYPVLPWIGIMCLGYCLGNLYLKNVSQAVRKKWLLTIGCLAILLFIVLRCINLYGDPSQWSQQGSWQFTILSFLNTTKYPPSSLYTLMTLAPALLFLAFTENSANRFTKPIIHIGKVPMFYYLLHIYLIHLLAMFAAEFSGFDWRDMILERRSWMDPRLKGFGFSLLTTYLVWIGVVVILYPLCRWYDRYKSVHREKWWLSYL
ncbi:MAG TPA: heparan-alpha-glucosaminide N-acetyltransferase domain-containing protein [Flavitalea sp.]|nr:heparan-alpha-glucosaminide N-acetyltransferase domain-containing protein [Flavitalea sp.]